MNIKDFIIPMALATLAVVGIRYYYSGTSVGSSDSAGATSFTAPKVKQEYEPLNKEIEFIDTPRTAPEQTTAVETTWGHLIFSTDGATLKQLAFKRMIDGKEQLINTIDTADTQQEDRCFLIALQAKTPYFYTLVDRKYSDDAVELRYEAALDAGRLAKTFIVYKHRCEVDLKIEVDTTASMVQPRVFFPAPFMKEIASTDVIDAVLINRHDTFEKIVRTSVDEQAGWYSPTLFGTDSRYFVHACVKDPQAFTKRAYYKFGDKMGLVSILEGAPVEAATSWTISFFMGPKESQAFVPVDPRLEQTMEYHGLLAPVSRGLLAVLNWLFSYVHNYGLAIILLTFLIKLVLLPFSLKGEQSMKKQREFQKKIAYLQQKHKANPELLNEERNELMRKQGVGGMIGGCLPILLQIPVFFALNKVLSSSFELYQAPMLWIPDLSATDPYYILPVLVAIVMILNAIISSDSQQMVTGLVMALVFGAITASFSAGLALYLGTSVLAGIIQTKVLRMLNIA